MWLHMAPDEVITLGDWLQISNVIENREIFF